MYVVTSAQMRHLEDQLFHTVPAIEVMELAGRLVAQYAEQLSGGPYAVLCGKGNNGGDGLVAARYLHGRGLPVTVVLRADPATLTPDAAINWRRAREAGVTFAAEPPADAGIIIDCILGIGVTGPVRGQALDLIEMANRSTCPILAVDLPSGVEADTGRAGTAVKASYTLAIGLPKWGHFLYPGALHTGRLAVADIGLPTAAIRSEAPSGKITTVRDLQGWLPAFGVDAHKGTRGRVVVVGGSRGMSGAPALAGQAALRSGAGLVTVAVPAEVQSVVAALAPEYTTAAVDELDRILVGADAVAVGPGMGTMAPVQELVRRSVLSSTVPVVLDADGLRAFAGEPELLRQARAPVVLTPHPGEMAALLSTSVAAVLADRAGVAARAAAVTGTVVLLKGVYTLIASSSEFFYINTTGNRALGTGGAGDVLTGVIAGLLAQGLGPQEAAAAGAYLHGLAADRWAAENGLDGMLAGDLLHLLPGVQRDVRNGSITGIPTICS